LYYGGFGNIKFINLEWILFLFSGTFSFLKFRVNSNSNIFFRKFSQSSSVTTHMRTHSGERPYKYVIHFQARTCGIFIDKYVIHLLFAAIFTNFLTKNCRFSWKSTIWLFFWHFFQNRHFFNKKYKYFKTYNSDPRSPSYDHELQLQSCKTFNTTFNLERVFLDFFFLLL
jgi:hypothetical protein